MAFILSIGMIFLLYYIFDNYGFKPALIINCIYGIIVSSINNGFNVMSIFLGIIIMAIETFIYYLVYNKSNSFGQFLLRIALIIVGIIIVIAIFSLIISGSNSSNLIVRRH